jgi:hypothetical protein
METATLPQPWMQSSQETLEWLLLPVVIGKLIR